jgi:hypothetical protein
MQIPVLVEPVDNNGFRARSGEPLPLTAEGATRDEALQKLRQLLENRLSGGAEITSLEVGPTEHPWLKVSGVFANDPQYDEWVAAMEENRRKADEDEGIQ